VSSLERRQAELVAALVAGGPLPSGFDPADLGATRHALLHKRAGEVRWRWPELVGSYGGRWAHAFGGWAAGRPPQGGWRDGWDFARDHRAELAGGAAVELAVAEARWRYDGRGAPTARRLPAVRRGDRVVVVQAAGRIWSWGVTRPS
jgi:hypothetical protein